MKKILFAAYGGGHINMLIPIARELQKTEHIEIIFLGLTTAIFNLQKTDLPFFTYKDLITKDDNDALQYGEELLNEMGDNGLLPRNESIAYLGLSYKDLVIRKGAQKAKELYKEKNRHAFLPLSIADRVIDKIKPDIIVSTNSPKTEKALLLKAQERNIASLCVVDLFNQQEFIDRLGKHNYGNKICVFTEKVREMLLSYERSLTEVVTTGNPALDQLANVDINKVKEFKHSINGHNKKILLWARQTTKEDENLYKQIEDILIQIASDNDDIKVIFRPHPNDAKKFNNIPDFIYLSKEDSTHMPTILGATDIVLSINSTVIVEAASLNKTTLTMETSSTCQKCSFANAQISQGIYDIKDLKKSIQQALEQKNRFQNNLPPPGNSAKKISQLIMDMEG